MFRHSRQDSPRNPRARKSFGSFPVNRAVTTVAGAMLAVAGFTPSSGGQTLYWDVNGANDGATDTTSASGTWDDFSTSSWTTDPTGQSATTQFIGGRPLVFSAGTNATGTSTIKFSAFFNQTSAGLTFEEGTVILTGTAVTLSNGSSPAFIANGATFDKRLSISTTGTMTIDGGTFIRPGWPGSLALTANGATLDTPIVQPTTSYPIVGTINMAPGVTSATLNKTGAAELQARSTGNFTTLNVNAGTYRVTTSDLGFGAANGTVNVADGATVAAGGSFVTITSPVTRTFVLSGNATFGNNGTNDWAVNSTITGSGNLIVNQNFSQAINLKGVNSYAGTTTIKAGTLGVFGGNAIPDTSRVIFEPGTAPVLYVHDDETIASLASAQSAQVRFDDPPTVAKTLTAGGDNSSTTFKGYMSGQGVFNKVGTGTTTLDVSTLDIARLTVTEGTVDFVSSSIHPNSVIVGDNAGGPDVLSCASAKLPSFVVTTGSLTINGSQAMLTLGTNHSVFTYTATLDHGAAITGTGTSNVNAATAFAVTSGTSAVPFNGNGALHKTTAGTVTLNGLNTYTGGTNVWEGLLKVKRLQENNDVSITGGTLQVMDSSPTLPNHPAGDNTYVSRPKTVSIGKTGGAYDGTLDLGNNDLILDYTGASPYADVVDMIRSGFNNGDWLGKGITSSTAANPLANGNYALGVAENGLLTNSFGDGSDPVHPQFDGQTVDDTTVLVKFTHRVDLDLNGLLDANDAAVFNGSFSEGDGGATWQTGDVDYDGAWTSNDAAIFNSFYDESLAHLPEPATVAVLIPVVGAALGRKRRLSKS